MVDAVRRVRVDTRRNRGRGEYTRQHYADNKARYLENNRKWAAANPEKKREISRRYVKTHRAECAQRAKAWAAKRKSKKCPRVVLTATELLEHQRASYLKRRANGYFSEWKKANKDKVNAATARRRARIKEANGGHHKHDIQRLLVASKGRCYWCRAPFGDKFEVEHVWPIALGGEDHIGNLCLSCRACNRRKSTKPPTVFAGVLL